MDHCKDRRQGYRVTEEPLPRAQHAPCCAKLRFTLSMTGTHNLATSSTGLMANCYLLDGQLQRPVFYAFYFRCIGYDRPSYCTKLVVSLFEYFPFTHANSDVQQVVFSSLIQLCRYVFAVASIISYFGNIYII